MYPQVTISLNEYERLKEESAAFLKLRNESKTVAFYVPYQNSGHLFYEVKIVNETEAIKIAREETEKYKDLYFEGQKKLFTKEDKKRRGWFK